MTQDEKDDLLIRISTQVEEMHERLFGNGQPGELDKAKSRIYDLEEWKNKASGGLVIISILIGVLGVELVKLMWK